MNVSKVLPTDSREVIDGTDELEVKAKQAVADKILNRDIRQYLNEHYPDVKGKHKTFLMFILRGYPVYKAYMLANNAEIPVSSAGSMGYRWLKKLKVPFDDLLEFAGHGSDQIAEALTDLKNKDSDGYLRHIIKLKKLDAERIEHSGEITIRFEKDLDD
jgi:hypothetical protein